MFPRDLKAAPLLRAWLHRLRAAGVRLEDALAPNLMTSEVIRKISDHHAMMINKTRAGMLVLGDDTLYTLEVNPAIYVVLAANEAEKASPIKLLEVITFGAVGRLWLGGYEAEIEEARLAIARTLADIDGRENK